MRGGRRRGTTRDGGKVTRMNTGLKQALSQRCKERDAYTTPDSVRQFPSRASFSPAAMGEVTPGTLSSPRITDAIQEPGRQAVRHHWSFISSENLISAFDVPTLFSYSRDHAFTAYKKERT